MHISIAAEKLTEIFHLLPLTNTLFTTWIVMAILIVLALIVSRQYKKSQAPRGIANFVEMVFEGMLTAFAGVAGDAKRAREFFGVVATIFFFVLFSNWLGLIPGVGSIMFTSSSGPGEVSHEAVDHLGQHEEISHEKLGIKKEVSPEPASAHEEQGGHGAIHLFRPGSSDLSFTLAIAFVAMLYVQIVGFRHLGIKYLGKFFDFKNPITFFVGLLELISEFAKMVSFSFRLFGNVFAGEVLLV